jgi:LacI family transcriptional regulator
MAAKAGADPVDSPPSIQNFFLPSDKGWPRVASNEQRCSPSSMNNTIPQRLPLAAQTADVIRDGIISGRWLSTLPGERQLSTSLQVSRSTLRTALAMLAKERLIQTKKGMASRIILSKRKRSLPAKEWRVACILPSPLWQQRTFLTLWLDMVRDRLQKMGARLDSHEGPRYYQKDGAKALEELTHRHPRECWLPVRSTHSMQSWFQQSGLPVILAGSVFDGITIPSLDYDHWKVGRHAAGMLLSRGHRRIAMICGIPNNAGVIACEAGFRRILTEHGDVDYAVEYHEETVDSICRVVDRLFSRAKRPTALFLMPSKYWVSASGHLAQRGFLVPRDVSVILAQDETYLAQYVPEPARYITSASVFAKHLVRMLQQMMRHMLPPHIKKRLLPEFLEGRSLRNLN